MSPKTGNLIWHCHCTFVWSLCDTQELGTQARHSQSHMRSEVRPTTHWWMVFLRVFTKVHSFNMKQKWHCKGIFLIFMLFTTLITTFDANKTWKFFKWWMEVHSIICSLMHSKALHKRVILKTHQRAHWPTACAQLSVTNPLCTLHSHHCYTCKRSLLSQPVHNLGPISWQRCCHNQIEVLWCVQWHCWPQSLLWCFGRGQGQKWSCERSVCHENWRDFGH